MNEMAQDIAWLGKLTDTVITFAVAYSFQILWSLILLVIGVKAAAWVGSMIFTMAQRRGIDVTISRFAATAVRLAVMAFVLIAILANFGISIAPLIALLGASAFGATVAIQGTLSNYGAGLSIILTQPFKVGDTISVKGVSGLVEEINLATTVLRGESGEVIAIPNRHIVGEIIVNSRQYRMAKAEIRVAYEHTPEQVLSVLRQAVESVPEVGREPPLEIGVEELTPSGMLVAIRYWAPTSRFFDTRFAVNRALLAAMASAKLKMAG
ncbi:MAG: mechanosensitive ion channel [Proteobacteria bacterium]|nr:mechanosensitive ion channel [Pseudomonadota bacterium]